MSFLKIPFSEDDDLAGVYMGTQIERADLPNKQNPWARWAALVRPERKTVTRDRTLTSQLSVAQGTPFLYGTVTNDSGAFPTGVRLEITKPDGKKLDTAHPFSDPDLNVILGAEGSVHMFMVKAPAAGAWTVTMKIRDDITDAHLVVSTMPDGDAYRQSKRALRAVMHDVESVPEDLRELLAPTLSGAWICRIVLWTIGLLLAAAAITLGLVLSETQPELVSFAQYIGMAVKTLLVIIKTIVPVFSFTLNLAISLGCAFLGEAPPAVAVTIESPTKDKTVSGLVPLKVSLAKPDKVTLVNYLVDTDTAAGSSSAAPFTVQWDSTAVPDGSHKLWAVAINGAKQDIGVSARVPITVQNS